MNNSFIEIVPKTEGNLLLKIVEDEFGEYTKENKRYTISYGTKVFAPIEDAKNWIEVEDVDVFLLENDYVLYEEPEIEEVEETETEEDIINTEEYENI